MARHGPQNFRSLFSGDLRLGLEHTRRMRERLLDGASGFSG
jgi:hypothetical protein